MGYDAGAPLEHDTRERDSRDTLICLERGIEREGETHTHTYTHDSQDTLIRLPLHHASFQMQHGWELATSVWSPL